MGWVSFTSVVTYRAGQWFSYSLLSQKIVLELQQNCERLTGKATYILETDSSECDTIRTFDVKGEVVNRFVSLNLSHTDPSRLGMVTFLLEVVGDGTVLNGMSSAYSLHDSSIDSTRFKFYRDEARAQSNREATKNALERHKISVQHLTSHRNFFVLPKEIEEKVEEAREEEKISKEEVESANK